MATVLTGQRLGVRSRVLTCADSGTWPPRGLALRERSEAFPKDAAALLDKLSH